MPDVAATPRVRVGSSKARPVSLILLTTALVLFGLTYYGVILVLASAPHLQNLDRATLRQAEEIKQLSDEVAAVKADNAELRRQIDAAQRLQGLAGVYGVDRSDHHGSFAQVPSGGK